MQHGHENQSLGHHQEGNPMTHDLARIWAEVLVASRTDTKARQFVDYFRADANRLFGASATPESR